MNEIFFNFRAPDMEEHIMSTAAKIQSEEFAYANQMQNYIEHLRRQLEDNPKVAKSEAKAALVRTGVLTSKGRAKKKIVSWE